MSIKELPTSERPRERLLQLGVEHLTTQELWMIVLGSGGKKRPLQKLATSVKKIFEESVKVTAQELLQIPGIGSAKACQIMASLELVERLKPRQPSEVLDSLEKVVRYVPDLQYAHKEQVIGLYLDARMRVIKRELLAFGSLNQTILSPRDIFQPIKYDPVVYLILVHNHPSGDVEPSLEDKAFTLRVAKAGDLLGIELLDHVIVGKEKAFSFKSSQLLR